MKRRELATATLLAAPAVLRGAPQRIRFPGGRDAADRRYDALEALLQLVLTAAGQVVRIERRPGLAQGRRFVALQAGQLDVAFVSSVWPGLQELQVLRQPLRRGLLGVRLLLTRRELAPRLAQLRSVAELSAWRLGYGSDWSDREQMRTLGFEVVSSGSYSGLFRMLAEGRFDWMHRGVNEIWGELDAPSLLPPGLVLVPELALYYPLDDYFCVSPQRPELMRQLELGFGRILRDGRYAAWFRHWHAKGLQRAGLAQRRVLHLAGYGVPPGTPLSAFDVLTLEPSRGEIGLP